MVMVMVTVVVMVMVVVIMMMTMMKITNIVSSAQLHFGSAQEAVHNSPQTSLMAFLEG